MPACLPVSSMFVHKAEFIPELIKTFCVNMSLWDLCVHGERDWPIIAKGGVSYTHQKASNMKYMTVVAFMWMVIQLV